jgi:hypothetical protein
MTALLCHLNPLARPLLKTRASAISETVIHDVENEKSMRHISTKCLASYSWQKEVLDQAKSLLGSTSYKTTGSLPGGDPFGLFTGRNKCNTFVADVLEQTSVEIDPPINGVYLASPPSATNWAGIHETSDPTSPHPIPGWKLTSDDPSPGYVTATGYSSGASGHCGIVDFDGQWISAGPVNVNRRADFVHYTSDGGSPASQRKR